ncbi:flagellin-like protein [Allosphingosinicella flava]|uniref:Flagellin-like protein n=1 Tax=Allosphingosinicella flava TaxID=2771430 RepID=A0A7T2LM98_9SPHN|nr:flagellin-like protein [Sphingosinicella flava]QPQ55329.1 flagellin-like protein [Sphingosinicella flava]
MINATRYRLDAEINRQGNLAKRIAHIQAQISTGLRIQAPSDDPIASARIAEIGRTQADHTVWIRNLNTAANLAANGYTALASLKTAVDNAMGHVMSARTGSSSDQARAVSAAALRDIAAQITALSQTRDDRGEPLFRQTPIEIPVGPNQRIAPAASIETVFGPIDVPNSDPMTLGQIALAAANAAELPDPVMRETALAQALTTLNAAIDHVVRVQGDQNLRGERIERFEKAIETNGLDLEEQRSSLESTDPLKAIADFKALDVTLDAAQAVFAQVTQKSLFDLLR